MEDDEVEWKALDKFEAKEAEEVKEVEVKASA